MGVVGSLPSPPPPPPINEPKIIKEEPISTNDDCSYRVVNIAEIDFHSIKSRVDNETRSDIEDKRRPMIHYGPIQIPIRKSQAPTLATGRRSKFLLLEGEEAARRELRRKRNRDAAKKLKEKRLLIEQQLQNDIRELENKEKELTFKVNNLVTYKEELEHRYEQIVYMHEKLSKSLVSSTRRAIYRTPQQMKDERRSPSPQWQLLFSI